MKHTLIDQITKNRTAFLEVIIATIILAISASGIASIIFDKYKQSSTYLLLVFVAVTIVSIIVLAKKLKSTQNYNLEIEAFLIIDPKENKLIDIPRYHYGEDLLSFINGAFNENPALLSQWKKEPIGSGFNYDADNKSATQKSTASAKLIKEATEYYILDRLSTHLTDYFNQEQYSKSELHEYTRSDVPDILLSNRFMELFTAPMENRASFDREDSGGMDGVVVMSQGKNGAIYHRFDLTLPVNTIVSRDKEGAIKFDTSNFTLIYKVNFDEYGFVSPRGFEEHYLGVKDYERSSEYLVNIDIEVKFKAKSLLTSSKWDYHAWLDGFLDSIEHNMSASAFFKKIKWDLAYTLIQCGEVSKWPNK